MHRLLDAGRRYDQRIVKRRKLQRDDRQLHRIGSDGYAIHRFRSEAAEKDGDRVGAGSEAREREAAAVVRLSLPPPVGRAGQRDVRPGQHPAGRIGDHARDLSGLRHGR